MRVHPRQPSPGGALHWRDLEFEPTRFEHREGLAPGFASRYGCNRFVFYESYERMDEAIAREKQIKAGSRAKKIALIETMNPDWKDLHESLA